MASKSLVLLKRSQQMSSQMVSATLRFLGSSAEAAHALAERAENLRVKLTTYHDIYGGDRFRSYEKI